MCNIKLGQNKSIFRENCTQFLFLRRAKFICHMIAKRKIHFRQKNENEHEQFRPDRIAMPLQLLLWFILCIFMFIK